MSDAELLIIVPTRSRPEAVARVVEAWTVTGAFEDGAELVFAYDIDDSKREKYESELARTGAHAISLPTWKPLVPKLNGCATGRAQPWRDHFAIGFAGDDHLPRTGGWARRYLDELRRLRTGVVSCPDGYRSDKLPTQWAMTVDVIRELGAMVPAGVEHLYCDNVVQDLATEAGCYAYLDDVLIEHMHPVAGKAEGDAQYERVNARPQYRTDRAAYREWTRHDRARQAGQIRALRENGEAA